MTTGLQHRAAAGISEFLGLSPAPQGESGLGVSGIYLKATGEINRGRVHSYGEYAHFDLYIHALNTAGRPVPNNPTSTLAGF